MKSWDDGALKSWKDGARGKEVKEIIDSNFKTLESRINKGIDVNANIYKRDFDINEWVNGRTITIPYLEHKKQEPMVDIYICIDNTYSPIIGGYEILNLDITLKTDMAYKGRVVIR